VRKLLFKYNGTTTTIRYSISNLKASQLLLSNKYSFIIDGKYNKKLIKKFLEHLFSVTVRKITTARTALNSNKRLNYKKVTVTLSENNCSI
jgi:ribosomal protein L23